MKRAAVTYVAAVAAAVSLGALGYAVMWGIDPADLGRPAPETDFPRMQMTEEIAKALARAIARQKEIAREIAKEAARPWPRRRAPRIALAPAPAGEDVAHAGPVSAHAASSIDLAPAAAAPRAAPEVASAFETVDMSMPAVAGEDASPIAAASPREAKPSAAVDARLPAPTSGDLDLIPQAGAALTTEPPAALPDPEAVGTVGPHPAPLALPRLNLPPLPPMARPRMHPRPLSSIVIIRGAPPPTEPGPLIIHVPDAIRR